MHVPRVYIAPMMAGGAAADVSGGVRTIVVKDAYIPPCIDLGQVRSLVNEPAKARRRDELAELTHLHGLWTEAGGRLLFDPAAKLPQIFSMLTVGKHVVEPGRCTVMTSPLWGEIDLAMLNRFSEHYRGNIGQAMLARDLSVVTCVATINIQKFGKALVPRERRRGERHGAFNERRWNAIYIDWRRFLYLSWLSRASDFWSLYLDGSGYDRFARDYFQGKSQKAWLVASSLLDDDAFAGLGWGKAKHTDVDEQDEYREALVAHDREGVLIYAGEAGYDQFARDYFQGKSKKAWLVASSLLDRNAFAGLEWGKQKQTDVDRQDEYRDALLKLDRDGRFIYAGKGGYDQFARDYFQGKSLKAWKVASSLLDRNAFAGLEWGKGKHTDVDEQDAYRDALFARDRDGRFIYAGEKGYDRFARDYFQGKSKKAWLVASSLLDDDAFAGLGWGKQKHTNVDEQDVYRDALLKLDRDGGFIYAGEGGYDQFARDYFQGKSLKAWLVASSLLDDDSFAGLGWGKGKHTDVDEQDAYRDALLARDRDGRFIYAGEKGYDQFARDYFQGRSLKAWLVASSLLDKGAFAGLGWGKEKHTNVDEQDAYRDALLARDRDGGFIYAGEGGYDRFARDYFQGKSKKAWLVASSLLDADSFAGLEWGKQKQTDVDRQDEYREALVAHDRDGVLIYAGEAGYDQFARYYFQGKSLKAWQVAASLLDADSFAGLEWGKQKHTDVDRQDEYREALVAHDREGVLIYAGEAGYDQFARDYFQGKSKKAWLVASSLLDSNAFAGLGWGKQKQGNLND